MNTKRWMYFYRYLCHYLLSAFILRPAIVTQARCHYGSSLKAFINTLAQKFAFLINLFPIHIDVDCFTLKIGRFEHYLFLYVLSICFTLLSVEIRFFWGFFL